MRKLTILLALAAVTAASSGCTSCCGRIRSWFHRGSPCGTTSVAPAVLGAPLAMGAPMMPNAARANPPAVMSAPPVYVEAAPQCCVPCNPCYDPCQVTTGYFGGYMSADDCQCANGLPAAAVQGGAIVVPQPLPE